MDNSTVTNTETQELSANAQAADDAFKTGDYVTGGVALVLVLVTLVLVVRRLLTNKKIDSENAAAVAATKESK